MWKELYDAVFKARTVSHAASVDDALSILQYELSIARLHASHLVVIMQILSLPLGAKYCLNI
jgi:hypothetical protein